MWSASTGKQLAVGLALLTLAACGGGGGGSTQSNHRNVRIVPSAPPAAREQPPLAVSPGAGTVALRILSPKPGDVAQDAVVARYAVVGYGTGFVGLRLHLDVGSPPVYTQDWPLSGPQGTFTVPPDPRISGRRDLRFSLVRPDGGAVGSVVVADVTMPGPR
jgi:hypothetical protein